MELDPDGIFLSNGPVNLLLPRQVSECKPAAAYTEKQLQGTVLKFSCQNSITRYDSGHDSLLAMA